MPTVSCSQVSPVRSSHTASVMSQLNMSLNRLDRLYLAKVADQAERYHGERPPRNLY